MNSKISSISKSDDFKNLLSTPIKDAKIFKAPGKGLVLKEVFYEN